MNDKTYDGKFYFKDIFIAKRNSRSSFDPMAPHSFPDKNIGYGLADKQD